MDSSVVTPSIPSFSFLSFPSKYASSASSSFLSNSFRKRRFLKPFKHLRSSSKVASSSDNSLPLASLFPLSNIEWEVSKPYSSRRHNTQTAKRLQQNIKQEAPEQEDEEESDTEVADEDEMDDGRSAPPISKKNKSQVRHNARNSILEKDNAQQASRILHQKVEKKARKRPTKQKSAAMDSEDFGFLDDVDPNDRLLSKSSEKTQGKVSDEHILSSSSSMPARPPPFHSRSKQQQKSRGGSDDETEDVEVGFHAPKEVMIDSPEFLRAPSHRKPLARKQAAILSHISRSSTISVQSSMNSSAAGKKQQTQAPMPKKKGSTGASDLHKLMDLARKQKKVTISQDETDDEDQIEDIDEYDSESV